MSAKKRGLGRGLDALIQQAPAPEAAATHELPIDRLRPNRLQPRIRFAEEDLRELAESIRAQGVIQPIVVTEEADGFAIIAGERRWRAAKLAGLEKVPVAIREVADDRELLELALVENLQRSDLDPLEEAEAYRALQETFGLTQEQVGQRVGKSRVAVTNAMRLLRLPEAIQQLLSSKQLTAGQARPLLGLETAELQIALAERAAREGLSAREIERLAAEPAEVNTETEEPAATGTARKPAERPDVHTAAAIESLTRKLQTRVDIRRRGKGGQIQLFFHSEDELIRLYDRLMERGDPR